MAVGGSGYANLEGLEISILFWFRMTSCDKAGSSVSQILRDLDLYNQVCIFDLVINLDVHSQMKELFCFSIQMLQFFSNKLVKRVAPFLTTLMLLLFL